MPVGINQPSNQIKLTNLALVRIKKGKKRFEVPCYKNKILDYRNKIDTELDNILQIHNVFVNVNKGQTASKADLDKVWPGKQRDDIIRDILENGEIQTGEKERGAELERTKNEVIDIVASKLVDPKSKRVYTAGMIEKALNQLSSQAAAQPQQKSGPADATTDAEKPKELPKWAGVRPGKDAKTQALFAMKALIAHQPIPVARMQMKLRITCPTSVLKQTVKTPPKSSQADDANGADKGPANVKDTILGFIETVQSQETEGSEWEAVGLVEPGTFKMLNEFIESQTRGRGNVEVLDMAVGADV
ncbi:unnamed protein product [Periconia digitata]|uniref:Shwachman-Bodian-diamond syndrome protein n=1 Tax=Periconia digitata TaxID=1303443 RepID=A0A9W4UIZ2_9PLEO|nr:unnamed protein product [Periconia digitata]